MRKCFSILLSFAVLISGFVFEGVYAFASEDKGKISAESNGLFYTQNAINHWVDPDIQNKGSAVDFTLAQLNHAPVSDGTAITLEIGQTLSFDVGVLSAGDYALYLKYCSCESANSIDALFDVTVNQESRIVQLPFLWSDLKRAVTDRNGDDITPEQLRIQEAVYSPFLAYTETAGVPALWHFETACTASVQITATVQPIIVYDIRLCSAEQLPAYSDAVDSSAKPVSAEPVVIEAEEYALKSDSYIRGGAVKNAALFPYDPIKKRLNVIEGSTWKTAGQKLLWEFDVETDGYYRIALRARQNSNTNKSVYRLLEVDGKIPYAEWKAIRIPYTGATGYRNIPLSTDGENQLVYLKRGKHTIALTAVMGKYAEVYTCIDDLMNEINDLGIALLKMTAGSADPNRTWDMSVYMPDAADKIAGFADEIEKIYACLEAIDGKSPVYANDLVYLSEKLRAMLKEPEKIPNKTEELCSGDSSAAKYLGDLLSVLSSQPLTADRIYIYGNSELPAANAGFFQSVWDKTLCLVFYAGSGNA